MLLRDSKCFIDPARQTDQSCILSWSCYGEGMRLPLRKEEPEGKLVLGLTQAVLSPAESLIFVSICCCRDFFFLLLLKIKANLRGARGSGQYHIGVWEQRGHRPPCDILFPQVITTSLHSFSSLDFLSGSSHHALLSAFNSFFSHLARKEEDWSAVCQAVSAAVPRGAGGRRPGEKKDLTWCESRTWSRVRPQPKCRSS